jgi:arginyl-tRNA synthetase
MFVRELEKSICAVLQAEGLESKYFSLKRSDRPDLSDFQSNMAMRVAKEERQNPIDVANKMRAALSGMTIFSDVTVDGPGFLNFRISDTAIINLAVNSNEKKTDTPQKLIIDYGGPNVAKPLHVGHLRSAIIGESLKRIARYLGHTVIADIHLGDWGTPMGMLIAEMRESYPEWPYFQENFSDANPYPSPIDVDTLNGLYPIAATHFKNDSAFAEMARQATVQLQNGHPGYKALWKHFIELSIASIKEDFKALDVDFDLWLGESDAEPYIEDMINDLINRGIARESKGALVIDVSEQSDKEEIHPLILRKSDGAATYATTDLATIFQRKAEYHPDKILYVVDKRQALHFRQVFRAAARAGYIQDISDLEHLGFGTMNSEDGKPFKTRDGGVMRLRELIALVQDVTYRECGYSPDADSSVVDMVERISVAAVKFGDLANPRTSDYIFNPQEFSKFEGRTGPYVQYATVRAKAVLSKISETSEYFDIDKITLNPIERNLARALMMCQDTIESAFEHRVPHEIALYAFELAQRFNTFYSAVPISSEPDDNKRAFRLALTRVTVSNLEKCFDLLAIPIPQAMKRAEPPPQTDCHAIPT